MTNYLQITGLISINSLISELSLCEVNLCLAAGFSYNYYNVGSYLLEHIDLFAFIKNYRSVE